MRYKLIAIDLDGTLLTDDKRITRENRDVLGNLASKGVDIIIATGRRYYSAKLFVEKLGIDEVTVLANNGTVVRNVLNDKIITSRYFNDSDFYSLIEEAKRRDLHAVAHVDKYLEGYDMIGEHNLEDERYCNYLSEAGERYRKVENILSFENPNALAVVFPGELDRLLVFKNEIETDFKDKFNIYLMQKLVGVSPILEIINSKGSKWTAITDYARQKGISRSEIIAIGDDNNDLEMIEKSGLGVGMKNASEEVLGAADIVTKYDNNNSGLARVLREIFQT